MASNDGGIYEYCLEPGCPFTALWEGGSAGDDPSISHLYVNPEHTVRSGVNDEHRRNYLRQKRGAADITEETA